MYDQCPLSNDDISKKIYYEMIEIRNAIAGVGTNKINEKEKMISQKIFQDPVIFAYDYNLGNEYLLRTLKNRLGKSNIKTIENASSVAAVACGCIGLFIKQVNLKILTHGASSFEIKMNISRAAGILSGLQNDYTLSSNVNSQVSLVLNNLNLLEKKISPKSGCFIATACYGDYNNLNVIILRNFRDTKLLKTFFGKTFIHCYYNFSPYFANIISKNKTLQYVSRKIIVYPLVKSISLFNIKRVV
ncbi:MAG: CFI-box-CTERM domain-containing protein [Bacteroidales bacterium]|nr:CFI-box-CTERM domain-containing protein [Bacteroidales bacterium]